MKRAMCILLLLGAMTFPGCSHVISRESRTGATPDTTFAEVRMNPSAHLGETLLLGGLILGVRPEEGGTTLEVLRYSLDRWGEPVAVDEAGRRFLVRTDRTLDPVLYDPGRLVTLTATLRGEELRQEGYADYRYPVFALEELYLWETPFRRGIKPHPNLYAPYYQDPDPAERANRYDPGYHPYPYTPYWIRPPGAR